MISAPRMFDWISEVNAADARKAGIASDSALRIPRPPNLIGKVAFIHSFIHSGHFYSAPSSPLQLRGAPDYSTDTVSEFHAEAHRQLQVKDLPKVPTWRLERESNPRPSG